MNKNLKVSIKTFGCQMNVYDSEVASGILEHQGYQIIQEAESEENGNTANGKGKEWYEAPADVVIMNTCSVREHAEDRVYSRLGMLRVAKETKPDMIVGLMGCMVEEHREKLFRRFPQLDFMAGTRNVKDIPDLIRQVRERRKQVSAIREEGIAIEYTDLIQRSAPYQAWLPIMTGCNKVCTFCIVPKTRGAEISMKARDVYREVSRIVESGVPWVTLLGQNVNSYHGEEEGSAAVTFPDLLDRLAGIPGLKRIAFTTSHPHDAVEELFQVMAKHPNISRRFHLPLQSGSDRMLKRMKRLHTFAEYKEKIDRLRALVPDVSVTTDIIVGFSGETEADHQETLKALRELQFDGAYIFKYSVRPGTPAAKLEDDVLPEEKDRRHQELLALQNGITTKTNEADLGKTFSVLLESESPRREGFLLGRTHQDKKVAVQASSEYLGKFVDVKLESLERETFIGSLKGQV